MSDEVVTLAAVVHGESGAGKSFFGGSTPVPRLILDAEGGSRYVRAHRRRKRWDPLTEEPPEWDGEWDACIVTVREWKTLNAAYNWLLNGEHPFKTVIVDSLTEAQKRLVDDVAGTDQPTLQDWGTIGRHFEDMVRKLRDLTFHETTPVQAVLLLCLSHLRDGETRPFLKGQIELNLPAFVDVVGYLYTENTQDGVKRRMLVEGVNNIIAKDRTGALIDRYGPVIAEASFEDWLGILQEEFGVIES